MSKVRLTVILIVVLSAAVNVSAIEITFIHEGSGSGTLNGNTFSDSGFTITAVADTDDLQPVNPSNGWYIDHLSASIIIDGLGEFDFLTKTKSFVNYHHSLVGFSRGASIGGGDLFNGPSNPAFNTWDMQSSIGPISGTGKLFLWDYSSLPNIETTGGTLIFDYEQGDAVFTAIVPEPATLLLFAFGSVLAARRRKQAT